MNYEEWKYILVRLVNEILLFKLLYDIMFIVNIERIELVGHEFRFLMERN